MVEQFTPQPINTTISIRPVISATQQHDATGVQTQLAALPPGTVIQGFVINRDAQNNPILRTPQGDLQLHSEVFLKTGSEVMIRVDATSDTRARIVTVDGMEPQEYGALQSRGLLTKDSIMPSQLLAKAPGAAPGTSPLPAGQLLDALLLQPSSTAAPQGASHALLAGFATGAAPLPAVLLRLQAGAALRVHVLDVQWPTAQTPTMTATPAAAPSTTPPGAPSFAPTTNMPSTAETPTSAAPASPAAFAGQGAVERAGQASGMASRASATLAMQPSTSDIYTTHATNSRGSGSSAAATATPEASPQTAIVIGHEADGGTILHARFGTLKIFTPGPLPVGTQVTLQVEPHTAPTATPLTTLPVTSGDAESITNLARGWPSLEQAVTWLNENDPTTARALMQQLPTAGSKLASGLLFFISAMKAGDVNQLLGKRVMNKLDIDLTGIARKLKQDASQMQQLFNQSPLQHWSGALLPIMVDGMLEHARLYVRNEGDDAEEKTAEKAGGGKGGGQRFIIEVDLSHLGDMQFDGFVQPQKGKQFDLVIRSARPLEGPVTNDIRALFTQALSTTGYKGYLNFQQGAQHFVRPLAELNYLSTHDQNTILA